MSREQEMPMQCQPKGPKLAGNPCQEIGAKTGRAIPTLMDKASLLK